MQYAVFVQTTTMRSSKMSLIEIIELTIIYTTYTSARHACVECAIKIGHLRCARPKVEQRQ